MGVEIADASKVASLLGTKIFVDEFISFKQLGDMVKAGEIHVSIPRIPSSACISMVIYHPLYYTMNKFVTNKSKLPHDGAQVFPYMG